jgi:hypothetical protein|nr:MAG TPA: hypothetical protein [Caudoviricetes sp.]
MERLTSNKKVSDMNVLELAYNSCYADKNHNARYRDYELDIDSRELVKNLVKDMCDEDLSDMSDEEFDEYMAEMLSVEVDSQIGLLALFYRNLWAMADLRENLKEYEDLEEQGRLIKLPCKVGDTVYVVTSPFNVFDDIEYDENMKDEVYESYVSSITFYECGEQYRMYAKATNHFIGAYFRECDFGKTVFLTKSEAEAKLKELRGGENE